MSVLLSGTSMLTGQGGLVLIIYVVIIGGMFYLLSRPQKKEQNRIQAMLAELEIGDTILTTSGFYGVVIDIQEDTVIVEFGNNKNCRIPMQKSAIIQAEKPGAVSDNK
ncbi:MAG: preprotein translocase subunit YajC [Lachnospiraceae bacterium]|nr:preprotein translocase subunit YajC [Lachnospiraceae bacterium]